MCSWYAEKPAEIPADACSIQATISKPLIEDEMPKVINLVRECYRKFESTAFNERIINEHSHDLPNYSSMCVLLLCMPVTSVECERAFSLQNRIKTKLRNWTGEERVDLLMRISMDLSVDCLDHKAAVRRWRIQKQRRFVRLYR